MQQPVPVTVSVEPNVQFVPQLPTALQALTFGVVALQSLEVHPPLPYEVVTSFTVT